MGSPEGFRKRSADLYIETPALRGKSVAETLSEETRLGALMSRPCWMWDLFVPLL